MVQTRVIGSTYRRRIIVEFRSRMDEFTSVTPTTFWWIQRSDLSWCFGFLSKVNLKKTWPRGPVVTLSTGMLLGV